MLDLAEELFDDVVRFVEFLVEGAVGFAVAFWRDHGHFPHCDERFS